MLSRSALGSMTTEYELPPCRISLAGGIFLEGSWNVAYQNRAIGICSMERQGLYWRINCRCNSAVEGICRLILECGGTSIDLGVLVPETGGFVLDKRIPVKQLPEGEPRFYIRSCLESAAKFVPVRAGEHFCYLSRLEESRFACRNGESGVLLKID